MQIYGENVETQRRPIAAYWTNVRYTTEYMSKNDKEMEKVGRTINVNSIK